MATQRRKPPRLTRADEEMVRAIRECRRRGLAFGFSAMRQLWYVFDPDCREYLGEALPAALEKAKEARR